MNPFETPKSGYPHWQGPERRVLDCGSVCDVKEIVATHQKEEMERYAEIIEKINHNEEKSNERHDETQRQLSHLSQSIEAYFSGQNEFVADFKRAFPKNADGLPDFDGHRRGHESLIENSKIDKDVREFIKRQMDNAVKDEDDKRFIKRAVIAALVGAFLLWAGKSLFFDAVAQAPVQAQVQGPK